jgi:hypothetical protein
VVALLFAGVYGLALIVAGFLVPVYSTQASSSSGAVSHGSATLVAVNGSGVVIVLGIPLLLTVAVGAALVPGRRWGRPLAWTFTGLLAVFNVLALLSIGLFVLPVTVALVVACLAWPPARSQRNPAAGQPAVG